MDIDAIRKSPLGTLVPISGTDGSTGQAYDHHAFLPHPLPRELSLASSTWAAATAAEIALARLDEAARLVPEPALLRRPALRREAQSTSALEGTYAPFETVLASEPEDRDALGAEVREVLNYVVAAEEGFAWVGDRPITRGLLEHLQLVLVRNTASEHRDAGRLRDRQVFIGPRGSVVEDSRFVPPPPGDQLTAGLDAWVGWLRDPPAAMPAVVRSALGHYQFETLHPFSDGNGRLGRLAIAMQLLRDAVLREPILVVSPWFEERRDQYQDELLKLSQTGDWDRWVRFFSAGLAASADTTRQRVDALLAWREHTLSTVRGAGVIGVGDRVAGDLIGAPVLRAPQIAKAYGVTPQGAMIALRRLVSVGVLDEERRQGRPVFVCRPVIDLLSA